MPPVSIEQVVPITTEDRSGFRVEVGVRTSTSRLGVDNDMAAGSKVEVTLSSKKPGCADITREQPVAGGGALTVVAGLELPPTCRHLWSPKSPFLYNLTVLLTQGGRVVDTVASYAGLRTYTVGAVDGVMRPLLNGKFVYQMDARPGVLAGRKLRRSDRRRAALGPRGPQDARLQRGPEAPEG